MSLSNLWPDKSHILPELRNIKMKERYYLYGFFILITLGVITHGFLYGFKLELPVHNDSKELSGSENTSSHPQPNGYSVTYLVEGTANKASLTYNNEQGGTQQENGVLVPWQKSIYIQSRTFLYISAQNQGPYGDIRVRIIVNGSEFKRSDSSGGYAIASASGSCCK